MEPKYEISLETQPNGFIHIGITRYQPKPNGGFYPGEPWGVGLGPDSDLDVPLPCQWEGDTEQTPVSLAEMFPAEYAYLQAKLHPEV